MEEGGDVMEVREADLVWRGSPLELVEEVG